MLCVSNCASGEQEKQISKMIWTLISWKRTCKGPVACWRKPKDNKTRAKELEPVYNEPRLKMSKGQTCRDLGLIQYSYFYSKSNGKLTKF